MKVFNWKAYNKNTSLRLVFFKLLIYFIYLENFVIIIGEKLFFVEILL